uniref:Putative DNA replication initiation protein n=3 Tax=viral metagenome TaxID=1070528 RepID=A0A6M3J8P6_9ZZZZ
MTLPLDQAAEKYFTPPDEEQVAERNEKFDRMARFSGMPLATSETLLLMKFLPGPGTKTAYAAALAFVGEPEHHFLTFVGEPGRGKTHLALGIGWHWLAQDKGTVKYWQVSELLDAMRAEFDKPPETETGAPLPGQFELAKGVSLLILDDLGVEKTSEWVADKLDTLVNHRWLEGKCTVFTTNLAPSQLAPRLRSRIKEGVTVTLEGPDYREIKAKMRRAKEVGSEA